MFLPILEQFGSVGLLVFVWVMLASQLSEGLFDGVFVSVLFYSEQFIAVVAATVVVGVGQKEEGQKDRESAKFSHVYYKANSSIS
jgi:hypothetical protein